MQKNSSWTKVKINRLIIDVNTQIERKNWWFIRDILKFKILPLKLQKVGMKDKNLNKQVRYLWKKDKKDK